jgi:hypothetical protein
MVSVPDAHIAAELGAMRTQVGVPQLFHADKTSKHLKEINNFRKIFELIFNEKIMDIRSRYLC